MDGLARREVPICSPTERAELARARARLAGWDLSVVVNAERVVLGLLWARAASDRPETTVEHAMDAAPATIRPHVAPEKAREYLPDRPKRPDDHLLVTTSEGRLIGLVYRRDLHPRARRLREAARRAA